jgi:gamma-glutamylcyclotransferase (GGCT)/AIG2-like uncharacterized protein YtfP
MDEAKHNLFVYGSLREPSVLKSVCGLSFTFNPSQVDSGTLLAAPAILSGHRRLTPDNVYYYAVADPNSRIEGFVIYDVPATALAEIDRYEGKRYDRDTVSVIAAGGKVEALAYLVDHKVMRKHFGDRFQVNLIHELWLRKRIERFLERHTRPGETSVDADLERRAQRELIATTERDLVMSHYRTKPVSDFTIAHELDRPRPSIKHLYNDHEARQFVENYIALVVRQVVLNQFEEKTRERYRYEIERFRISGRYYNRSVSLFVALRMMNSNARVVDLIVQECLNTMPYPDHDLIDYVKYAVSAADSCFTWQLPRDLLARIPSNFQPGLIPLGAEIELSNLGYRAVPPHDSEVVDYVYDNFRYFHDFKLDILTWKLGGYIDDHRTPEPDGRKSGFFECAPGRLNAERELSRPATADPWLLNQLIHEMIAFYHTTPHSLHLSFQVLKKQVGKQNMLPLEFVKCLFALGGGLQKAENGKFLISRMANNEIIRDRMGEELVFSRTSKRNWYLGEDDIYDRPPAHATTWVQQYKYIRLDPHANYEQLILALKGLQMSCNPGDYLTSEQLKGSQKLRDEYAALKEWAAVPRPLSSGTVADFMDAVREGLMQELRGGPAHKLHYIQWGLSSLRTQLQMFNKRLAARR